jgi:hypothetical protein
MLKMVMFSQKREYVSHLILSVSLAILLGLLLPTMTLANPPDSEGAGTCVKCHEQETDAWRDSPHAKAVSATDQAVGAGCESCHGSYTVNHPKDGLMRLNIDSSICEDCHSSTFSQWEDTKHADAGVQCIGCHLSHSQKFRLSDEKLCVSCHRDQIEEAFHVAHATDNILCTDCHVSSTPQKLGSAPDAANFAPNHDFANVASEPCVECHRQSINAQSHLVSGISWENNQELLAERDRASNLAAKLETTQQENKSLESMVPISLGLGMGIGVMLGVILVLVIGYVNQRRATG